MTEAEESHAEQVALRRAAYRLEEQGLIQLISQRLDGGSRLVAYRPDFALPETSTTQGIDGKFYRRPVG